jgi:general secretion pathway protein D
MQAVRYLLNVRYLLFFSWMGLLILSSTWPAQGARIADEDGVTSVVPEPREPAKRVAPSRPPVIKKRPPVRRAQPVKKAAPAKPIEVKRGAQVKEKVVVQQKKVTNTQEVKKKREQESRYVTIDFDNVDINLFIKFISELTGKNFIIDKAVRGKVTIISPTKISIEEAYKVFESVLEVHGFTTVPAGSVIKVVPAVEARSKSIETRLREEAAIPEDRIVTQLIPLDYANPDELSKLFRPLISKSSVIVSYDPTRTLIVTDVESNIKRLLGIVREIDIAGIGEEVSVIPIAHATASTLSKSLSDIFQTQLRRRPRKGTPSEPIIRIVADERTNSLITLATEDDTRKIKELVALLDKPIPRGEGDIHVYYLQNANAEDLQKVLMAIPSKEIKTEVKGKAPVVSKDVQIVADKATNSLVITAKKHDYLVLEDIIKKLDIPRSMVYLEALIMEVNVDKEFRLGVEWLGMEDFTYDSGGKQGGFFAGSGGINDYGNVQGLSGVPPTLPSGFSLGVFGEAIQIGDVVFPNLGAIFQAYQKDSDVNIISTPQILTTDNEEAEIYVGENVPYLTKEATGDQTYQTYEYRDVGVTLKITPQINQERFVRLNIFQENISLKKGTEIYRPTTLKRSAETTVIIKDKNTVVIGGIIGESAEKSTYKTPCLGDIPGLRWLFSALSRSENKTNLFVFITPYVIESSIEAKEIYDEKNEVMQGVQGGAVKMYEKPEREDRRIE